MSETKIFNCKKCNVSSETAPKFSFLGFSKFTCPNCKNVTRGPMKKSYRIISWIILVLGIASPFAGVAAGEPLDFGTYRLVIIALIAFALFKDYKIRKELK